MGGNEPPETLEEAGSPFHPRFGPLERLLRWGGKHHEQAHRIGTVSFDQRLGIDPVVFGLGHLLDAA
jgi:hypothetical protein